MINADRIRAIVGKRFFVGSASLRERPQDFWSQQPTKAMGLARPGNVAELCQILALCDANAQAVIVEGGRTNLVGGTISTDNDLLVSLDRLDTISPPDPQEMTVTVEAGAILETIQQRCSAMGLRFGLDFGARGSATLGGALSTNAGGFQALRYGVARNQVLGLECVLANGTILSHLIPYAKDNTGYDLKQLFIGSEGTLGVITKAVLKLHPTPLTTSTALLAFDDFDAVIRSFSSIQTGFRGMLSSFEIMWEDFFRFNVKAVLDNRSPIAIGYPFYVLCEAEGFDADDDAARFEEIIGQLIENGAVADAVIATSSRQRSELWKIREDLEAELHHFRVMIDFDISLPIAAMDTFARRLKKDLDKRIPVNLGLHIFGHIGDGNLHLSTGLPSPEGGEELKKLVYDHVAEFRGSISAEHGIGLMKKKYLHHSRTPAELETMRLLKCALDPRNTLNPGKVI